MKTKKKNGKNKMKKKRKASVTRTTVGRDTKKSFRVFQVYLATLKGRKKVK